MNKTYVLNIAGTCFSIVSDESEEYIRSLEAEVEEMVVSAQLRGASSHKAALFVCMELCDMLKKSKPVSADEGSKRQKKSCEEVLFPDKGQTTLF